MQQPSQLVLQLQILSVQRQPYQPHLRILCQYYVHYLGLASGLRVVAAAAEGQKTERVHPLMGGVSKYCGMDAGLTQVAVVHR